METKYSSSINIDMQKEYLKAKYPGLKKYQSEDIVFQQLTFDELGYLMDSDNDSLILWVNDSKEDKIVEIQEKAMGKNIHKVYLFDLRLDGVNDASSIYGNINQQPGYEGSYKGNEQYASEFNYIYGELVNRYLTNLDFEEKIVWLDKDYQANVSSKVELPFFFHYKKDEENPVICWGDVDEVLATATNLTDYSHQDYVRDAFKMSDHRGHLPKTEDSFKEGEQINVQPITFDQLNWMVSQNGKYVIVIAGPWCANSQAGLPIINDYAVANDVTVYMFDFRLDNKYPFDFWAYPRNRLVTISAEGSPYFPLYVDLLENKLSNIQTIFESGGFGDSYITYVDPEGNKHQIGRVQAPHLLAFDGEHVDNRGNKKPILAYCERMYELIDYSVNFIYEDANYKDYKAGVYKVMSYYCRSVGQTVKETTVDRTSKIVERAPGAHYEPETVEKNVDYQLIDELYSKYY